ncbi:hypothetical protein ACQCSU_01535 [Pseudarthrobacter sp. O4]|uniref:hypothetical protein n=1 Tax=Pseudarthrobacter sp. O4 TaxID=3418417 RepID=UPI003CF373DA
MISSIFLGRVFLAGWMAGLFEMVRELFFSVRAPFPDGAHLLRGQVFAPDLVSGVACAPGSAGSASGGAMFGVIAHGEIVPQHFRK